MRVLVVEDEADLANAIARGLRREGYAVDVAYDGDEALETASVNAYDVLCLDLNLPGVDGIEVCRRVRAEQDHGNPPRVLMLTARDGTRDRVVDLDLDAARHEARRGGRPLPLTPKEFSLLRYFMSRAGHVLSQEDLLEHVWDENADPFTNTVRVTVMTLRRKLAEAGEGQPIETVVGRGYRLRAEP